MKARNAALGHLFSFARIMQNVSFGVYNNHAKGLVAQLTNTLGLLDYLEMGPKFEWFFRSKNKSWYRVQNGGKNKPLLCHQYLTWVVFTSPTRRVMATSSKEMAIHRGAAKLLCTIEEHNVMYLVPYVLQPFPTDKSQCVTDMFTSWNWPLSRPPHDMQIERFLRVDKQPRSVSKSGKSGWSLTRFSRCYDVWWHVDSVTNDHVWCTGLRDMVLVATYFPGSLVAILTTYSPQVWARAFQVLFERSSCWVKT